MCFAVKVPKPPPVPPTPNRAEQATAADEEVRKRLALKRGMTTNIFTSPMGDPGYGKSSSLPSTNIIPLFGTP